MEPVRDDDSDDDIDCIYNITMQEKDWVNSTVDGRISWDVKVPAPQIWTRR